MSGILGLDTPGSFTLGGVPEDDVPPPTTPTWQVMESNQSITGVVD